MDKQAKFSSRILDQEPDTIAVIPQRPEYAVVGTYSLIETDDDAQPNEKSGSLQIIPFLEFGPALSAEPPISRLDFPFGIYDIQFHALHPQLLGVATSEAKVLFYLVQHEAGIERPDSQFYFTKIGEILVENPRESDRQLATVTQLQFINILTLPSSHIPAPEFHNDDDDLRYLLVATTQFGSTKLVEARLSRKQQMHRGYDMTRSKDDSHATEVKTDSNIEEDMQFQVIEIHKQAFDLEAWTNIPILYCASGSSQLSLLLLAGGDDCQLLVSHVLLPKQTNTVLYRTGFKSLNSNLLLTHKKDHQAGVVCICDLQLPEPDSPSYIHSDGSDSHKHFILTGSYDEHLRLFLLTMDHSNSSYDLPAPPICSLKLLSELKMGGGVWRIKKLDEYFVPLSQSPLNKPSDHMEKTHKLGETNYILLIAGHTSGAHIVRLTISPTLLSETGYMCDFKIEKTFTEGHESLVYAVEARNVKYRAVGREILGLEYEKWDIISTSFYDKKMCNWGWIDEKKWSVAKRR